MIKGYKDLYVNKSNKSMEQICFIVLVISKTSIICSTLV